MENETTGLRSCPFCGSPAQLQTGSWAGVSRPPKFGIDCTGCEVKGKTCDSEAEAVALWNRRAAA